MNWQAVSFDWNQIRAFLATVEEGSFSAAARVLGSTQPTVGRQIAGLEADLGVTLFDRAGRALLMTSAARELLEHVQAMGDAASRVSMGVAVFGGTIMAAITGTLLVPVFFAMVQGLREKIHGGRTAAPE